MSRVLRMQAGDTCMIQENDGAQVSRWTVELSSINKKEVICTIREEVSRAHA